MSRKKVRIEWVKQFESGRIWLDAVAADHSGSADTQSTYARSLYEFCQFTGKDPDQLIAERKEQLKSEDPVEQYTAENLVRGFCLQVQNKSSKQTARQKHAAIRSFYRYNRQPLQIRMPKAVFRRIEPVTFEELKLMDNAADERERLIIRFLKDSGISVDDAADITYGHIRRDFERGEQFIHLNVIRKKEQIRYETFVGPNTVEAIKVWFQIRKRRGETVTDDSPLFTSVTGRIRLSKRAIRAIVERAGQKVGITASTHRLRKFFDTYMALTVRSPAILRYWMGHSVVGSDIEGRYILPPEPEQRALYAAAYNKIDLTEKPQISKEDIISELPEELLEPIARKYGLSPAEVRRVLIRKAKGQSDSEITGLSKVKQKDSATKLNGGDFNSHAIITEEQLLSYLDDGWEIVKELSNGHIVVRRVTV